MYTFIHNNIYITKNDMLLKNVLHYFCIFGCAESSLLLASFLWLQPAGGHYLIAVLGLLIAMASLVEEYRL